MSVYHVTENLWVDRAGKVLKTPEPGALVFAVPGMILPDETARAIGLIPETKVVYPEETKVIWPPETKRRRGRPRKVRN